MNNNLTQPKQMRHLYYALISSRAATICHRSERPHRKDASAASHLPPTPNPYPQPPSIRPLAVAQGQRRRAARLRWLRSWRCATSDRRRAWPGHVVSIYCCPIYGSQPVDREMKRAARGWTVKLDMQSPQWYGCFCKIEYARAPAAVALLAAIPTGGTL